VVIQKTRSWDRERRDAAPEEEEELPVEKGKITGGSL